MTAAELTAIIDQALIKFFVIYFAHEIIEYFVKRISYSGSEK